ncbi:MAG: M20/M25/M40 family metallo-hydrolase, partial [Micropepsaceae bacterium]
LAPVGSYAGKIVFINDRMKAARDGSGYGVAVRKRSRGAIEAAKRGAVAVVIRSVGTDNTRFPHTGNMNYDAAVKKIPAAAVSNADADQIERLNAMGVGVRLKLLLKTREMPNAPSGNVVADIVGVEKPEEIVLLAAHLDSWDLGTGAIDDATGVGIVVAAALRAAGPDLKPKRTIRVVLYGAEEVGVHGGDAYAKAHAGDVANHVMATEADFGTGRVWRFASKAPEADLPFFDNVAASLRDLGVERGDNKSGGGADIAALAKKGVPIVGLTQDGTTYFDLHHTANDTLDKVDAAALEQNVEVYARVARAFANR